MFYPYRLEHYSHLELQMTSGCRWRCWRCMRFGESLACATRSLAALCAVAQLYSSMYYGVFFPFYAVVVLGMLVASSRAGWRRRRRAGGDRRRHGASCWPFRWRGRTSRRRR